MSTPDQLANFPILKDVFESLENKFKDSILESSFEKQELSVTIKKEDLVDVLTFLKHGKGFNALNDMVGLDNHTAAAEGKKRFSILYLLYKFPEYQRIRIKIDTNMNEDVDSIIGIYKASDWAEREIYDMFGIRFTGHPNLKRVYMPEEFVGYPLRKDFPMEGKK
jgi:NADH-quinone oxidoreductase subunit C